MARTIWLALVKPTEGLFISRGVVYMEKAGKKLIWWCCTAKEKEQQQPQVL